MDEKKHSETRQIISFFLNDAHSLRTIKLKKKQKQDRAFCPDRFKYSNIITKRDACFAEDFGSSSSCQSFGIFYLVAVASYIILFPSRISISSCSSISSSLLVVLIEVHSKSKSSIVVALIVRYSL